MDEQIRRKLTREEYELQFFGFSHTILNNYVRSVIREEIITAVTSLMENLKKNYSGEILEDESDLVRERLIDLYMNASKIPFSNVENMIEECISVPDHVLLAEDEKYQRNQHAGVHMNELDSKIEELERRAVKAKYMESQLKEELATYSALVELGTRKVNELQKRALSVKQKDKRNMELVEKLEAEFASEKLSSDLDTTEPMPVSEKLEEASNTQSPV